MQRTNPDIDIIMYVLEAVIEDQPHSTFAKSLHRQYCERGGLSKKQLEGLHSKASKIENIHPGRMATLQAIILKKHTRHKSEITVIVPQPAKDENTQKMIEAILAKYPEHKRVLFFKARNDKNELLSPADIEEINRFAKLLLKD
ncbi:MAG: hypothetical protein ABJA37_02075 [Ferruginibacter sp.]